MHYVSTPFSYWIEVVAASSSLNGMPHIIVSNNGTSYVLVINLSRFCIKRNLACKSAFHPVSRTAEHAVQIVQNVQNGLGKM